MVKERLKYIDIPKYPNVGQGAINIIEKRLSKIGYKFVKFVDGGAFGKVFYTNKPGIVCKITKSDTEAYISELIKNNNNIKSLPKIYNVFLTKINKNIFYVILMEQLYKSDDLDDFLKIKISENVNAIFENHNVDLEFFIQCYALLENIRVANIPSNETSKFYNIFKKMEKQEIAKLIKDIKYDIGLKNKYFSKQFESIIDGINFLKLNDISYADIATRNLLVDSNNNIKIIDFGYSYISNNKTIEVDEL